MLNRNDNSDAHLLKNEGNINLAMRNLVSSGKSAPTIDFVNLIEYMTFTQQEYQARLCGMSPKELQDESRRESMFKGVKQTSWNTYNMLGGNPSVTDKHNKDTDLRATIQGNLSHMQNLSKRERS